jgi:hypothetical protein
VQPATNSSRFFYAGRGANAEIVASRAKGVVTNPDKGNLPWGEGRKADGSRIGCNLCGKSRATEGFGGPGFLVGGHSSRLS